MGGRGSGRRSGWGWKTLTTERRVLDVRQLNREGILSRHGERLGWRWPSGSWIELRPMPDRLVLSYRWRGPGTGGEWKDAEEEILLTWTRPHYGGRRPWFRCPACNRRVAILYGGARFICRRCDGLAYPSQNESDLDRRLRRANKIRRRLGGQPGMLTDFPPRPRGMHRKTYDRLRLEVWRAEDEAMRLLVRWLNPAARGVEQFHLDP